MPAALKISTKNVKKRDDLLYWVALNMTDMTPRQFHAIHAYFKGEVGKIFSSSEQTIGTIPRMTMDLSANVLRSEELLRAAERECRLVQNLGIKVVRFLDEGYPNRLKEISDPPPLLYIKGELPKASLYIGVVGTRRATSYGLEVTRSITKELSDHGVAIVSGLARGIDRRAHETALRCGGFTVAVLGNGLSVTYPFEHRKLFEEVPKSGALVSEFSLSAAPLKHHFPRRNRVISGLSHGVLVVEAPKKSGALITADFALEQGREVYAVPGPIISKNSQGPNKLIQQGATLITSGNDILEDFNLTKSNIGLTPLVRSVQSLTGMEKQILETLHETHEFSGLVDRTSIDSDQLSQILMTLEMKGLIGRNQHQYYRRAS